MRRFDRPCTEAVLCVRIPRNYRCSPLWGDRLGNHAVLVGVTAAKGNLLVSVVLGIVVSEFHWRKQNEQLFASYSP